VAGVVLHRSDLAGRVAWIACGLVVLGVGGYAAYPAVHDTWYYMATAAVAGMGIGALTLVLCLAIIGDARQAVALAALPSIAIMVGTEVGLELLQCAFAAARGIAASPFPIVFAAQAAAAVAVVPLLRRALRHG